MSDDALHDLNELLRLRELRTAAAARDCALRRQELQAAEAAVSRRIAQITHWQQRRADLAAQIVGPHARDIARFAASTQARRAHIHEQIEREEYALLDDERDLHLAQERLADALARWSREHAREDGVRDLLRLEVQRAVELAEAQIEAEAQDLRHLPGVGSLQ